MTKLATERQKEKMRELDITFDEETTLDEAADAIRAEDDRTDNHKKIRKENLSENVLVTASEWED